MTRSPLRAHVSTGAMPYRAWAGTAINANAPTSAGTRMRRNDMGDVSAVGGAPWTARRRYFFLAALRATPRSADARFARSFTLRCRSLELRTFLRSPRPMIQISLSVVVLVAALRELFAALLGGVDRIQEGRAHAGLFEVSDRLDRRSARRGHHLTKLDGVLAGVAQHLGRPEHRLDDQLGRDVARQPEQDARLDHRLGQQEEVRWPAAARRRHGVEMRLLESKHLADVSEELLGQTEVPVGPAPARGHDGPPLVDHPRPVRHPPPPRPVFGQVLLHERGSDPRREAD